MKFCRDADWHSLKWMIIIGSGEMELIFPIVALKVRSSQMVAGKVLITDRSFGFSYSALYSIKAVSPTCLTVISSLGVDKTLRGDTARVADPN